MKTKEYRKQLAEAFIHVLEEKEVAPKKSREELNGMVREIKEQLEEIREDNQFFHGFIEKHGIPMPDLCADGKQLKSVILRRYS